MVNIDINWFGLFLVGCVLFAIYDINKDYKLIKKMEDKAKETEE